MSQLAIGALDRIPTAEEFAAFDGEHCRTLWTTCAADWRCPGCNRTRFELLRWTKKIWYPGIGPDRTKPYWGWKAALHRHHDHARPARFDETVVCDQCNSLDAIVKRYFGGIRPEFSYSPDEIRQIVSPAPHRSHKVDFQKARRIYNGWLESKRVHR